MELDSHPMAFIKQGVGYPWEEKQSFGVFPPKSLPPMEHLAPGAVTVFDLMYLI